MAPIPKGTERITFVDMFQQRPVQSTLFTFCPLMLALVQLVNSFVNGLSFFVSVPFAFVMIGFAVMLSTYRLAQYRRRHIEQTMLNQS